MTGRILLSLVLLALAGPAWAAAPDTCRVAEPQIERDFALPQVTRAIAAKQLDILVVGAGSSSLPGPNGVKDAYPARLQSALAELLPGVTVRVTTDVKPRRTATQMVKSLIPALAAAKPALMVWQTGTVDAMQSIDTDQFKAALDHGISVARRAGADVVLINAQYSPRTESMIALAAYAEIMRWVALQQEVPVFDRFSIMKLWADLGTFDLYSATKKLDIAAQVHDCIGYLLADLVIESAKPEEPHAEGGRQE
ncbi:MAG TPA: GDSL-type esterase/lipase family protein [Pseudolabrys sp.]|nr:GDSL-type esterase/lipase family protein [Pseudolabrys sp.]